MAVPHGIQNLNKGIFGQSVIANESTALGDVGKEVTFGAVLQHHKRAVRTVQDSCQGDHVRVVARVEMQSNLATLETLLPSIQTSLGERFHRVCNIGEDVDGFIHHTVGTHTQDGHQF